MRIQEIISNQYNHISDFNCFIFNLFLTIYISSVFLESVRNKLCIDRYFSVRLFLKIMVLAKCFKVSF